MHYGILAIKIMIFYFHENVSLVVHQNLVGSGNEFTCIYFLFLFLLLYLFDIIILI